MLVRSERWYPEELRSAVTGGDGGGVVYHKEDEISPSQALSEGDTNANLKCHFVDTDTDRLTTTTTTTSNSKNGINLSSGEKINHEIDTWTGL